MINLIDAAKIILPGDNTKKLKVLKGNLKLYFEQ
jgi:hypothetical protein